MILLRYHLAPEFLRKNKPSTDAGTSRHNYSARPMAPFAPSSASTCHSVTIVPGVEEGSRLAPSVRLQAR
eukprot:1194126-Prorocentrum_minimum.AAC.1